MADQPDLDIEIGRLEAELAEAATELKTLRATLEAADALFAAIGKVAEAWAAVELVIDQGCWVLAAVEDIKGACLTSQVMGSARKLDAFIALVRLRGGDDALVKRLNKFAERARGLQEQRNRIVHDPWLVLTEDGVPQRYEVSARRVARMTTIPTPTSEVSKLCDQIEQLLEELLALREITDHLNET
jgi:hypothetical protein